MTGKNGYIRGLGGVGLAVALVLGIAALLPALAEQTGTDQAVNAKMIRTIQPLKQLEFDASNPTGAWEFGKSTSPRSGFYPLPLAGERTMYDYENDWVYVSGSGTSRSRVLDVITTGGSCPTPPMGVKSIYYVWQVKVAPVHGLRVVIKLWNTFTPTAAAGSNIMSDLAGGIAVDYGPLTAGLWGGDVTLTTPWYPTHPDNLPFTLEFTDNVAPYPMTSSSVCFTTGPPQVNSGFPDNPTGSSANWYYRDFPLDGIIGSNDGPSSFSSNGAAYTTNFDIHVGGFPNPVEVEPNDSLATAGIVCDCSTTASAISPAGDVDMYKLLVSAPVSEKFEVLNCTGTGTPKLTVLDSGGSPIYGPVTGCGASITTAVLALGTYYVDVQEVSGTNTVDAYDLKITPLASGVTGMKFTTAPTKDTIVWDSQGTGSTYDIIRGNIYQLHVVNGDFTDVTALTDCWDVNLVSPTTADPTTPLGPSDSLFYLSRAKSSCGGIGTYNEGGAQVGDRDPQIATNANTAACP